MRSKLELPLRTVEKLSQLTILDRKRPGLNATELDHWGLAEVPRRQSNISIHPQAEKRIQEHRK